MGQTTALARPDYSITLADVARMEELRGLFKRHDAIGNYGSTEWVILSAARSLSPPVGTGQVGGVDVCAWLGPPCLTINKYFIEQLLRAKPRARSRRQRALLSVPSVQPWEGGDNRWPFRSAYSPPSPALNASISRERRGMLRKQGTPNSQRIETTQAYFSFIAHVHYGSAGDIWHPLLGEAGPGDTANSTGL